MGRVHAPLSAPPPGPPARGRQADRRVGSERLPAGHDSGGIADRKPQVTYNGHPLYTFLDDQSPGQANGQGSTAFGAGWFALNSAGNQVTGQLASSTFQRGPPVVVVAMATRTERPLYTAAAHVTGGRAQGHGRTSDGALEVDLRLPTEMGGEGGGTNPEQLFAVGYAARASSPP